MDGPNFDPVEGEEVRVEGYPGLFRIAQVHSPLRSFPGMAPSGLAGMVTLESVGFGATQQRRLDGIPWTSLRYTDESRPVRRAIEWLKTNPDGKKFPEYVVNYEVKVGDDHAGNPSIFVRFLVDPDYFYENGRPSQENIAALNKFTFEVQQFLLGLDLDRWIFVRSGEARRALDVAS